MMKFNNIGADSMAQSLAYLIGRESTAMFVIVVFSKHQQ